MSKLWLALGGLYLMGCPLDMKKRDHEPGPGSVDLLAGADCDPMVPTQCGFPFPSNVYLVDDTTTHSGKRVKFGATTLPVQAGTGKPLDPALWADCDGFSAGQAPMTHMPGATTTGLPTQDDIALSLSKESPTILIEAVSGEPVPHFAELDMTAESDDDRTLMLRPVTRLKDATRYIVAIRNVVDDQGVALAPNEHFRALRDGTPDDDPTVVARRALYEDILSRLSSAAYPSDDLQIAWDYTTASRANNTQWMLHMRDEALATVGSSGPQYVVDEIEEDPNEDIKRRIHGRMTVPLYLDTTEAGGKLVFGDDGLPEQNGTGQFEFLVHIPHSATTGTSAALLQNGHGLLGSKAEGRNGYLAQIANRHNFVAFSVDMIGMAEDDEVYVGKAILEDLAYFKDVVGRQHQGMLNSLLAMRMMKGRFVDDDNVQFAGQSAIDPSEAYYRGDSQGGIFGGTYMALSTDVTRGLLGEPGMPYNLLLNRSVDFDKFFVLIKTQFANYREIQVALGLVQMLWDRTEPSGYVPYINRDLLPNTPSHEVLIHVAIGDYQVTPLGAHIMARSLGAQNLGPVNREVWGVPTVAEPFSASGLVEFGFGLPEAPKTNTPPVGAPEDDPHDKVRVLDAAIDQTNQFLREGLIGAYCDGACDPQ